MDRKEIRRSTPSSVPGGRQLLRRAGGRSTRRQGAPGHGRRRARVPRLLRRHPHGLERRAREPEVNAAVIAQVDRSSPTSRRSTRPCRIVELAEKLARVTPGKLEKSFFTASGTEATRPRSCWRRSHRQQELIALRHGYSGARARPERHRALEVPRLAHADRRHQARAFALLLPLPVQAHLPELRRRVREGHRGAHPDDHHGKIAGFMAEPIQGVGGFITPPTEYFQIAVEIVRATAASSSATRCRPASAAPAKMWGIEHYGVEPDIMTMAKGIANGLPLGAVIATTARSPTASPRARSRPSVATR
jgi:alanine-glyoxylate transaminase / (R)-3-amino-2-methylpropionate-pyruvate transaminase